MVTQEEVKQTLLYDPGSGKMFWIKPTSTKFKPGNEAGYLRKSDGYWYIGIKGKQYKRSRLVWLHVYGYFPAGPVSHVSPILTDDRLYNLFIK